MNLFKSIPNLLFPQDPTNNYRSPISRPIVDTTRCKTFGQAFELADELEQTQVCKLFSRSDLSVITNNSYFTYDLGGIQSMPSIPEKMNLFVVLLKQRNQNRRGNLHRQSRKV
jgi:hypothetical protein